MGFCELATATLHGDRSITLGYEAADSSQREIACLAIADPSGGITLLQSNDQVDTQHIHLVEITSNNGPSDTLIELFTCTRGP
jgi:hypothetical protein